MENRKKTIEKSTEHLSNINNCSNEIDEEVLNLDELFGVQGGINTDEKNDHIEETCGLGCYNMNIVINNGNENK